MRAWMVMLGVLLVAGCDGAAPTPTEPPPPPPPPSPSPPSVAPSPSAEHSATPSPSATATASPSAASPSPSPEVTDPRWRFFTDDRTRYASPWYEGRHRLMIDFGCSTAPYYSSDPRCPGKQGFHHGIDVAMPCGTLLRSGVDGKVRVGGLGAAYGAKAFLIRTGDRDVVVGHARELRVRDGQQVRRGDVIAVAGDLGAPDGCHLHLEQRSVGGGLSSAKDPRELLQLQP